MATLTFVEPSGDRIEDVTVERVVELMRTNGEYWGPYSPAGQLLRRGDDRVDLFLVRHPRRGWYVQYDDLDKAAQTLVAVELNGVRDGWVEHWAEGDTSFFLAACFVPQAAAERVVTDFAASGRPSAAVAWEPMRWDTHRREEEPEDEGQILERAEP